MRGRDIQIGGVLGKIPQRGTDGFDRFGDTIDLVSRDIVQDDDIARCLSVGARHCSM